MIMNRKWLVYLVEKLLILEVTDQGLGISQEDQHNLFKQFF